MTGRIKQSNMLEKGMLATLTDGKSYIVISIIELENIKYIYMVENERFDNMKFYIEEIENDRIKLIEIEDLDLREKLLKELIRQFQKETEE